MPDLVKNESVSLGTTFGVASKYCSFVAIEKKMRNGHNSALLLSRSTGEVLGNASTRKARKAKRIAPRSGESVSSAPHEPASDSDNESAEDDSPVGRARALIQIQSFDGAWRWEPKLFQIMNQDESSLQSIFDNPSFLKDCSIESAQHYLATLLVVVYLQTQCDGVKETWELVVEKAKDWLRSQIHEADREKGLQERLNMVAANMRK
ncbi:hypothetical protein KEM56_001407 [Ascosphaera pollenicola]|nr:hypothetical protein KEM56_001407 [Ascosphaera pollenicola]